MAASLIDGEVVCCGEDGIPVFQKLRYRRGDFAAFLYAFDLLKVDGKDLRREPFESRKAMLAKLLRNAGLAARERAHGRRRPNNLPSCLQDGPCARSRRGPDRPSAATGAASLHCAAHSDRHNRCRRQRRVCKIKACASLALKRFPADLNR
jgi:hypothetical protein